jgi:predicted secreted acid phosphatase
VIAGWIHAARRGGGGRASVSWLGLALAVLGLAGCATTAEREPPNLEPFKQRARDYVAKGHYQWEMAAVAAKAQAWIEERAAQGGARLTVVFDIDETLLSNWASIRRQDFGYVPEEWQRWVDAAEAPAIEPVREVFRAAQRRGVEVVLLTGRRERDREATERNLRAAGCTGYVLLICRPEADRGASADFKTAERRKLSEAGRTIIANLGDQESDLSGGFAERTFKLPNPFYRTE